MLLGVWGVGRETADSILCYGFGMPVFGVAAYTRRIFGRLGLADPEADYDAIRADFEKAVPEDVAIYRELHALIVRHGVETCLNKPKHCAECAFVRSCKFDPETKKGK
jgi:endonuclease-3 related protein